MNRIFRMLTVGSALIATATASVLACGTPTQPPPPPPDPPIVCCQVIRWIDDPATGTECLIVRYFRKDGQPLFQSNPMPLLPTQQCLCAVPPLPKEALAAGAVAEQLVFGTPNPGCQPLPGNVPGYGPFAPLPPSSPESLQVDSFFDIYYTAAASDPEMIPPNTGLQRSWAFSGPGTIPPGQVFDVYVKIRVPAGFDPRLLCVPCQRWIIGLFLVDNGQVMIEPAQPGPAIPLSQFGLNPGNSSFYKFTWYPLIVPGPCPLGPNCPGDTNGDNVIDLQDLNNVLFNFGLVCP